MEDVKQRAEASNSKYKAYLWRAAFYNKVENQKNDIVPSYEIIQSQQENPQTGFKEIIEKIRKSIVAFFMITDNSLTINNFQIGIVDDIKEIEIIDSNTSNYNNPFTNHFLKIDFSQLSSPAGKMEGGQKGGGLISLKLKMLNNRKYNNNYFISTLGFKTMCNRVSEDYYILKTNNEIAFKRTAYFEKGYKNKGSIFDRLQPNNIASLKKLLVIKDAEIILQNKINTINSKGKLEKLQAELDMAKIINKKRKDLISKIGPSEAMNYNTSEHPFLGSVSIGRDTDDGIVLEAGGGLVRITEGNRTSNTTGGGGTLVGGADMDIDKDSAVVYEHAVLVQSKIGWSVKIRDKDGNDLETVPIENTNGAEQLMKQTTRAINMYEKPFKKIGTSFTEQAKALKVKKQLLNGIKIDAEVKKLSNIAFSTNGNNDIEVFQTNLDKLSQLLMSKIQLISESQSSYTDVIDVEDIYDIVEELNTNLIEAYLDNCSGISKKKMVDKINAEIKKGDDEEKISNQRISSEQATINRLASQTSSDTDKSILKFSLALAYRKYRDISYRENEDQQSKYDKLIKEILEIKSNIKQINRSFYKGTGSREKINNYEKNLTNKNGELFTIVHTCFNCVIKDKRDDLYKVLSDDPDNDRYLSKIVDTAAMGSSLGRKVKINAYNIGVKNIYDFHDAFHEFREFRRTNKQSGDGDRLYESAMPFFYEDKIRIALLENNTDELKKNVAFLQKRILEGEVDDIGGLAIKEKLYDKDSNLKKQYDKAKKLVKFKNDVDYQKIQDQYNKEIDFGFLVSVQKAQQLLKEKSESGIQPGFLFEKNDWAKSERPINVKIDVDNLNRIIAQILIESRKIVKNRKNDIYDKNHLELPSVMQGANMWFFMRQSSREQENNLIELQNKKEELFEASFKILKIIEYYRNSAYTDKLKDALANENIIWARKNLSVYNLIKNEHARLITQLKEYGKRLGTGGDGGKIATLFNKYTATLRKTKSRIANINSAEKSKNIIIARTNIGGHRPIVTDDIKDNNGKKLSVKGRQPLYDLTANNLLNIERYLGVYSDSLPINKIRKFELSKYGELVNAYRELAFAYEEKQDSWTAPTEKTFNYIQLPSQIKQVIEFWRRDYGETEPIKLNDNVISAGMESRMAAWGGREKGDEACDDLLDWENDTFKQFISEHGKKCLEKQAKDRTNTIAKRGCGNFNILYNSVSAKDYDNTLKKLLPFMEKCNKENQYDKVDGTLPKNEKSDGKSLDDIEGKISNAKSGVDVTSRDLGNQGEVIIRLKFDKSKAAAGMVGDLGTNNRYYWKELQSVLSKMNTETQADPAKQSNTAFEIDSPPDNATKDGVAGAAAQSAEKPTSPSAVDSDKAAKAVEELAASKAKATADAKAVEELAASKAKAVEELGAPQVDSDNAAAGAGAGAEKKEAEKKEAENEKLELENKLKEEKIKADKTLKETEEKLKQSSDAERDQNKKKVEEAQKAAEEAQKAVEEAQKTIQDKDEKLANSDAKISVLNTEKLELIAKNEKQTTEILNNNIENARKDEDSKAALKELLKEKKESEARMNELSEAKKKVEAQAEQEKKIQEEQNKLDAEQNDATKIELQKTIDKMAKDNETKENEAAAMIKQLEGEVAEGAKKLKGATSMSGRIFGVNNKNVTTDTKKKGGSTNRRYSFKKLQKRKRANKSNKAQAKRGKQLNRSKKMRR
tara:strand:- start:6765 stop:11861 length:5097 start_codon:yes stop_codon:yes gene_type:complete